MKDRKRLFFFPIKDRFYLIFFIMIQKIIKIFPNFLAFEFFKDHRTNVQKILYFILKINKYFSKYSKYIKEEISHIIYLLCLVEYFFIFLIKLITHLFNMKLTNINFKKIIISLFIEFKIQFNINLWYTILFHLLKNENSAFKCKKYTPLCSCEWNMMTVTYHRMEEHVCFLKFHVYVN